MTTYTPPCYSATDWDRVRTAFFSSVMVNVPLSSLAQSLEGADWPVQDAGDVPANYIDLEYPELLEVLAMKGQSEEISNLLIEILRETLAFDEPFGEMAAQSADSAVRDNPLLKNLKKLGIPTDFPMALAALSPETLSFCRMEKISTLGVFATTVQNMAKTITVGGDFRKLLNALSVIDENTIAACLPYRPGTPGLHLPESLVQAVRKVPPPVRIALARQLGVKLTRQAAALAAAVSPRQMADANTALRQQLTALRECFPGPFADIKAQLAVGADPEDLFSFAADPIITAIAADLLRPVGPSRPAGTERTGWFARLLIRWRKE